MARLQPNKAIYARLNAFRARELFQQRRLLGSPASDDEIVAWIRDALSGRDEYGRLRLYGNRTQAPSLATIKQWAAGRIGGGKSEAPSLLRNPRAGKPRRSALPATTATLTIWPNPEQLDRMEKNQSTIMAMLSSISLELERLEPSTFTGSLPTRSVLFDQAADALRNANEEFKKEAQA